MIWINLTTFKEEKYIAYYLGNPNINCHIDAVHSKGPKGEINTKKLVIEIIKKTDCSGIYSLISRTDMDLNRPLNETNEPAILEYRTVVFSILNHLRILDSHKKLIRPYLHLALHGMRDNIQKEIEVGTINNQTCSDEILIWFRTKLEEISKELFNRDLKIVYNQKLKGNSSKVVHRDKYGSLFNTIQIEINRTLRTKYFNKIIEILSKIIINFYQENSLIGV